MAFSPCGRQLASASDGGSVKLWDLGGGEALQTLQGHSEWVKSVSFSPDGERVVSVDRYRLRIWDLASEKVLQTLKGPCGDNVSFSMDGKRVAFGSLYGHGGVYIWDLASGQELQ